MPFAPGCRHRPKKGSTVPYGHGEDTKGKFQIRRAFCKKCQTWYVFRVDKEPQDPAEPPM